MPNISIKTPQHVSVDYELATWGERMLASIIDLLIKGAFVFIFRFLFDDLGLDTFVYFIIAIVYSLYSLMLEIFLKGKTIGKLALKIRVVNLNGETIELSSYFNRWFLRIIDLYGTFGVLATISCLISDKKQRIGDLVANTIVVKEKTNSPILLKEIIAIRDKSDSEIMFPLVTKFTEEQMLFAKNTLQRVQRNSNIAHQKSLYFLCKKMSETIGVEMPKNQSKFIKQLISDYILSTR